LESADDFSPLTQALRNRRTRAHRYLSPSYFTRVARRFSGNKKISSADSIFRDKVSLFTEPAFAHGGLVPGPWGRYSRKKK
jgi:hypothetical protein